MSDQLTTGPSAEVAETNPPAPTRLSMGTPIAREYGPDDWPRSEEDATADRVARHLTRAGLLRSGKLEPLALRASTPKGDVTRLYIAQSAAFVSEFGCALLLRELAEKDPALADDLARRFWDAAVSGDTMHELLWEWGTEYGQDSRGLIDEGRTYGERAAADRVTELEAARHDYAIRLRGANDAYIDLSRKLDSRIAELEDEVAGAEEMAADHAADAMHWKRQVEALDTRVRALAARGHAPTLAELIAALNGPTSPGECGEILPDTTACREPAGHDRSGDGAGAFAMPAPGAAAGPEHQPTVMHGVTPHGDDVTICWHCSDTFGDYILWPCPWTRAATATSNQAVPLEPQVDAPTGLVGGDASSNDRTPRS